MIYGYARVLTDGQSVDAQVKALARRRSREDFQGDGQRREDRPRPTSPRPSLSWQGRRVACDAPRPACALDARPTQYARHIAKAGAGFRSLADAWADTTTAHGRLMLTVLGGLAEFERDLIRARTGEGRERAKARGVHMGRPRPHASPARGSLRDLATGTATQADLARRFNVSRSTISRLG